MKTSNVSLRDTNRTVVNKYYSGDIYDFKTSLTDKEDNYVDHEGNEYIYDKQGRKYPVSAKVIQDDAGRIAGGSTKYRVIIYFPGVPGKDSDKEASLYFTGYIAVFSQGSHVDLISDLEDGFYLEDYILKHEFAINGSLSNKPIPEFYDQLIANAESNVKSDKQSKTEAFEEYQKKFDLTHIPVNLDNLQIELHADGSLTSSMMSKQQEFEVPQNIIDVAIVGFETNGYVFEDFTGCTFTVKLDTRTWNDKQIKNPIRYNLDTQQFELWEQRGSKYKAIDFENVSVKINTVAVSSDCPFAEMIQKASRKRLGRKSTFITADAIWNKATEILMRRQYDRGYYSDLRSSRNARAQAKKYAREELNKEWEDNYNKAKFSFKEFKEILQLLPAKDLESSQNKK